MKKTAATIIAAITATSMTMGSMSSAQAHDTGYQHWHKGHYHYHSAPRSHTYKKRTIVKKHNNNAEKAIVFGLFGLAAGAAIAHSISKNNQVQPKTTITPQYRGPNYYPHAPKTRKTYTTHNKYAPWSPSWYQYCQNRYRSFNPTTGTFRGYDGRDHFCVVR